jgi:uncharacterized protein YjiK
MKNNIIFIIFFISFYISGQQLNLSIALPANLEETSGLLFVNNTLVTINDSGSDAELYQIDPTSGNIIRSVPVNNATNTDWEAICADDTYIYIGDFGNNRGNRTDLKIYRISISDFLNMRSVNAEIIYFSYADQTNFSSQLYRTNFDAEALIAYNNQLYVFTKNWGDGRTNIYAIPNIPGTYSATQIDSFNPQGLITDATYNSQTNDIVLTGYTYSEAFIVKLAGFSNGLFSNGSVEKTVVQVPTGYSKQIEGIAAYSANEYYISAERHNAISGLYYFNIQTLSYTDVFFEKDIVIYPNPASQFIHVNISENEIIYITNSLGEIVLISSKKDIKIAHLANGYYLATTVNKEGQIISQSKFMISKKSE